MAQIPRHIIDAVRDATDIVEVVQKHVRLNRRGSNWVGLCPFHQEKSPSFNVIQSKGIYHCFGCQAGGDVFRFLMQLEGLSFVEAVKELATPAGIPIEEQELSPEQRRAMKQRATFYDVLEEAASFFESVLWTRREGEPARAYLDGRAMAHDTARAARLGYAPGGWTTLIDHLHRQGFDPAVVQDAGLAREREHGGRYDAFRERVMFPIRDEKRRVIGFGGRILAGDAPKYINGPETRLYEKSKVLYGFETAWKAIHRADRVIVVEGYFDVLSMHQAGFEETVATCGTALTREHLEKIRRHGRNVIVLLDSDSAGMRAAERVLPLFRGTGMQPWRLQLPDAKDPDELVREQGAEAMEAALKRPEPLLEWVLDFKLQQFGTDAMSRERALEELLPLLTEVPGDLLSRVAARVRIDERALLSRVEEARKAERRPEEPARPTPIEPPDYKPQKEMVHLLWLLVHRYDSVADLITRADPAVLEDHAEVRAVVARLVSGEPVAAVLPDVLDRGLRRTLSAVVARGELYQADQAGLALCQILDRLGRPRRDAQLARLTAEVEDAARNQDNERLGKVLRRQAELRSVMRELETSLRKNDLAAYVTWLARLPPPQA